jgi:hypothetical protein
MVMALCGIRMRRACGIAGDGRLADSTGARWQVVTEPPWHGRVRARALVETHGHGPSWATGPQALPI